MSCISNAYDTNMSHLVMMSMSASVISAYRIGYRYWLILLLNIGYRNNRLFGY